MEDIVTQRVNEFRQGKQLSILALSKVLEMNQTTLNKQLKEDGCGVQVSTLVKILSAYPELSAEWLLRGDGEMKKGESYPDTKIIFSREREIERLQEENSRLLSIIEALSGARKKEESA